MTGVAENPRQVFRGVGVDGQTKRKDARRPGFENGLTRVFDAVRPLVAIDVVRPAVGKNQQQTMSGRSPREMARRKANRRAEPREAAGLDPGDAPPNAIAVVLGEIL